MWQEISPDRILTHDMGKTGQRMVHKLKECPLVIAELDRLPAHPRIGPVIIDGKTGEPFRRREYSGRWRETRGLLVFRMMSGSATAVPAG